VTFNGRFDAITTSPATDCNQHGSSGASDGNEAAAAIAAIGAMALIGALAASRISPISVTTPPAAKCTPGSEYGA
jgi:hypothetical protein